MHNSILTINITPYFTLSPLARCDLYRHRIAADYINIMSNKRNYYRHHHDYPIRSVFLGRKW